MAVQLCSTTWRGTLSQPSPACAWLMLCDYTDESTVSMECLEVTTSWIEVNEQRQQCPEGRSHSPGTPSIRLTSRSSRPTNNSAFFPQEVGIVVPRTAGRLQYANRDHGFRWLTKKTGGLSQIRTYVHDQEMIFLREIINESLDERVSVKTYHRRSHSTLKLSRRRPATHFFPPFEKTSLCLLENTWMVLCANPPLLNPRTV